ncbi:MAG: YibE/F family protein [Tindallia sp. MSAO_Bac2]|nr:MAG: YibE/F family protein [Tindallia sp. MSAO_Bac2]
MRKTITIIFISVFLLFHSFVSAQDIIGNQADDEMETMRGIVLDVEDGGTEDHFSVQMVTLEIYSGSLEGNVELVENHLSDHPVYDIIVEPGDRVLLLKEMTNDGAYELHITEYVRDRSIFMLLLVFVVLLVLVGRLKGLKTLLTLGFTFFMIVQVMLPGMLRGYSPILLTIISSFVITIATILIINGINSKSFSAIIGIFGGLLAAGLFMFWAGTQVKLTGLSSEEATMLMYIPQAVNFDFRDLLFAGIIMGSLGAVMDVGISVASSMEEIRRVHPDIAIGELMKSGMNVGQDIMGTMSNTLILAYTGAALPLLLLFMAYEASIIDIINLDIIATEIVRALSGSIGLVLTVPLTVLASAVLLKRRNGKRH